LSRLTSPRAEEAHPQAFASAAAALSRDRSSNFSPVVTAILRMCLSVVFKYVFLDRDAVDEVSPQHIDIWSLSSSLVMVHIVSSVLLASVVGVQQSAYTAQGILEALEERVLAENAATDVKLVDAKLEEWKGGLVSLEGAAQEEIIREILGFNRIEWVHEKNPPPEWQGRLKTARYPGSTFDKLAIKNAQVIEGAVPSFRPESLGQPEFEKGRTLHNVLAFLKPSWVSMLATVIVSVPPIGGTILAAKVPPEGMNYRAFIKLLMLGSYWVKFLAQVVVNQLPDEAMGKLSGGLEAIGLHKMAKQPPIVIKMMVTALFDSFALLFFATIIFSTQSGNLSRPGCYCETGHRRGQGGLSPRDNWPIVQGRMATLYPGILFGLLGGVVLGVCPALVFFLAMLKMSFCRRIRPGRRRNGRRFCRG
jgi:hypothetical protein